jgi:transposase
MKNGWYNNQGVSEMKGKRFDPEFKKTLRNFISAGANRSQLAEELGIHPNTVYKWAEQYRDDPEQAFPGSGKLKSDEDELRKAQRKIKQLQNEIAILKQAAVYFAKNSK